MIPLLKAAAVFSLIIVLLRVKLPLGAVLALATALLLLLFGSVADTFRTAYWNAKFVGETVSLTLLARAEFGRAAALRPQLMLFVVQRLAAAGIALRS